MNVNVAGLLGELSAQDDIRYPSTGIPNEALAMDCADEQLKVTVLQEFLLIDQKYTDRVDLMDEINADIVWYGFICYAYNYNCFAVGYFR